MELPTFTVTFFAKLWAYGRIPTLMSKATNDQGSPIAPAWVCLRALFQSAKVTPKALARNPKANETPRKRQPSAGREDREQACLRNVLRSDFPQRTPRRGQNPSLTPRKKLDS